jgi:hypothetical protein
VCFGSAELTLEGESIVGFGGVPMPGSYEPLWLINQLSGIPILIGHAVVWVRVPPELSVSYPSEDGVPIQVTGHLDDPAAFSCRVDPEGELHATNPEAAVLYCRQQFVVSSFSTADRAEGG